MRFRVGSAAARPWPRRQPPRRRRPFPADNPWNRDVSAEPVDPNSGEPDRSMAARARSSTPTSARSGTASRSASLTSSSPGRSRRCRSTSPTTATRATPARIPSRRTRRSRGPDGTATATSWSVDRDHCMLYELFGASPTAAGWRRSGRDLRPRRRTRCRPDGLDVRRRGRPADLPRPRALRRGGRAGRSTHALRFTVRSARAARTSAPGDATTPAVEHRPEPPADGHARAPEGELRRLRLLGRDAGDPAAR